MKKYFIKCTATSLNSGQTFVRFLGKEKNITNPADCTENWYAEKYGFRYRPTCERLLNQYKHNISSNENKYGKAFNYKYEIVEVVL